MIYLITAENRHRFHHLLEEMHRQRKAVFIDQLGWRLNHCAGLEIDDYDCPEAYYLIKAETARTNVRLSARLLPTDRPHLLGEQFAHLCDGAPPQGPHIWEATRFCPAPGTPVGAERRAMLGRMIAGIMEAALLFGVERVTYIADAALAPMAARAGWEVAALGPADGAGRDKIQAFVAEIDASGLRNVRAAFGLSGPVTRYAPAERAIAA